MAIAATSTQAPLGAVATLRVVDSVLSLKEFAASWNDARATRKALLNLSSEQLEDIGLCRADIL
ncbi:DUF1127 domain-containing protein [Sulfitobacter mediterraneus]|jgi:uncharacterized protein YjiS (DUF1127 family)|uniref:DUF1127 domain-containing protein n=1 Tax=Sulfitobacter mediterraneus TaxID=83219 RepID=UPI0021A6A85B|nr:DUF1127 domain-containing protein [Sulfitobacter mediterraneus]UWR10968.1 DUF1127 domain-containing protein [Sulfitobacter mediterraneus]